MAGSLRVSLRSLLLGCMVMLAFPIAAPAARATCDDQLLEQPFMPWSDFAYYILVGDGDLTGGGAGWALHGAKLVDDNEPWYVHGGSTPAALRLDSGDSAITPPMCVSLFHPTLRFFVRNGGGDRGSLSVEVVLGDGSALPVGVVDGPVPGEEWAPSPPMPVVANLVEDEAAFRFTATGPDGSWVIDDVYVDPYKKG
jgi:hypothetical protein